MPERAEHPAHKLLHSLMETFADTVPKQKSVRFYDEGNSVSAEISTKMNRLFGRQKSVHKILGGGQSADVLLWRNKKISLSVLAIATAIWVLFEWLNYHFLSLVCFALAIGMVIQFFWSNASGFVNRSPSEVPRLVLPDELFANIAISIGAQINQFLGFIQDVACGRNLKQFAVVFYYYLFDAASDSAKLYNDLRWNISRPQGFEAVMRVRCSQGLQVQEYSRNFCRHISTDIDLPAGLGDMEDEIADDQDRMWVKKMVMSKRILLLMTKMGVKTMRTRTTKRMSLNHLPRRGSEVVNGEICSLYAT